MGRLISAATRLTEMAMVILLAGMAMMVFVNVVLRYGLNSGITFSEELSRYFFVWLTFIGAVITFKENAHIGVETMVRLFGRRGRLICMFITNVIVLICAVVFFHGTWVQHPINASMTAAVVGISLIWVFGVGYFSAAGIGLIAAVRLGQIVTGRMPEEDIARFAGDYDDGPGEPGHKAEQR
ncbi:TRAP transporter small permease [uncultured Jannaschia sp.]|uniref:TRAP transporter small permease n=1 Tax=uncultured Jannaschia sp. TaxID=293347 RepID=UPI002609D7E8|nr:TRAP transporter small permease [uncultured Jannaschia sp.]